MFTRLLIVGFAAMLAGCDGRPMYPFVRDSATPGNHLETKRGGRMQLDLNSNATAKMTGLRVKKSILGGTADIDYLEISQDVIPYWAGSNQAMLNYGVQQQNFVGILDAHYAGLTKLIPAIIHEVAPILLPWIQARGQVDLQRALRPTLVEQLTKGLTSNLFSPDLLKGALNPLDPTLVQDVINKAAGIIQPLSQAPAAPIDTQTLNSIGKPSPLTTLPPRRSVQADDLTPAELPPLPSRDDVRREFALSEVVQAGLPEMELVRFK